MIQRVQSVYLLFVAILSAGVSNFLSYGFGVEGQELHVIQSPFLLGIYSVIALIAVIAIFMFKNRKLQFVLGRINILLNFILLGLFVYWSLNVSGETVVSEKGIGMLIPIISIVLLVIANKAIKKDEHLVKSVDRLR
ncbi:DUF4293 domain-containing protein [Aquimarina hainanensis]|uniref:DUF4293 domain-containing protein n=1 Tax=Aquimarina hainanensis TaxID=1578017 RepID=A0ABW5NC11_9FLAO|nr:DUF4293 domain-containing protein [Aquimarina sp. TRL1]QKX03709.1 DUF4293 domain-containing protein [Aquimarina sp. TRL1]